MDISDSTLWREVDAIIKSGVKPVHHVWSAKIYAGDDEIVPFKILSIDIERDYLNNYTDYILLDVMIPLGTYAKRIYPNLDDLDIELKRSSIGETSDAANMNADSQVERFTAIMMDSGNPIIESSVGNATSEEELNRIDIPRIRFQLLNKSVEQIRVIPAGGIYRNMTGEDLVKSLLSTYSRQADVDEERKVKGVMMVKASNQKKRESLILPHNLKLVDVPHHVHYYCGGLYSAGLGYYLQDNFWWVFPVFDNTRFNDGAPTLTIVNVPRHRLPGIERTFRKDGNNLVVLATGDTKFSDIRNLTQLNAGNGVRFADATQVVDNFVTIKDNKAVAARTKTNTEMIGAERANKINNVPNATRSINSNPFVEFSKLTSRQGSGVSLVWENADHTLLSPGMPVRVMYLEGDDVKDLYGVLQGAHLYSSLRENDMTSNRYVNNVTLSVFVKPLADETDPSSA